MARGLPAIASDVGGIRELLPQEDLVTPADPKRLEQKIWDVTTDSLRMSKMAARNLEASKQYSADVLNVRRLQFYREVMRSTRDACRPEQLL
jgi:glycosyltransferase involved in cell wall biosynthesis